MRWRDNFRIALGGIAANKLRSALTVLGVLIGVAAVVILVAVGTGSSKAVADQINRLGTNTLTVSHRPLRRRRSTTGTQSRTVVADDRRRQALEDTNNAPDVLSVSPVSSTSVTATYDGATTHRDRHRLDALVPDGRGLHGRGRQPDHRRRTSTNRARVDRHRPDRRLGSLHSRARTRSARRSSSARRASRSSACSRRRARPASQDQDAVVIAPYTAVQDLLTGYSQSFSQLIVQGKSASTLNLAQSEVESILASANDTTVANLPVPRAQPAVAADRRDEHLEDVHRAARRRRRDLAARRRHRRDEHHARHRHRAHARDRHPQGDRRAQERDPDAVPARGRPALADRRRRRHRRGPDRQPVQDRRRATRSSRRTRSSSRSASRSPSASSSASTRPTAPPRSAPSTPSATSRNQRCAAASSKI